MARNRLTVKKAAKLMEASEQFIRLGLQQGIFPWGYAVKTSTQYTYFISSAKFAEFIGVSMEEVNDC